MKEYILLTGTNEDELVERVNAYLSSEWELQGGACMAADEKSNYYAQALVKEVVRPPGRGELTATSPQSSV